jgi:hypothetical protein
MSVCVSQSLQGFVVAADPAVVLSSATCKFINGQDQVSNGAIHGLGGNSISSPSTIIAVMVLGCLPTNSRRCVSKKQSLPL